VFGADGLCTEWKPSREEHLRCLEILAPGGGLNPQAPSQGGSQTASSVGSAIYGAAFAVGAKLLWLANQEAGSL
jgi:hypothetical protein